MELNYFGCILLPTLLDIMLPLCRAFGPSGHIGPFSLLGQLSYAIGSFLLPTLSPPVADYRAHSFC